MNNCPMPPRPIEAHPMWAEQVRIEEEMSGRGVARFQREAQEARNNGEATKSGGARFILTNIIEPTAKAIAEFVEEAKSGKAGRKHTLVRFVTAMAPDVLAYLTAKVVLDGLAGEQKLTRVAVKLGRVIQTEQRLAAFAKINRPLLKTVVKDLRSRTTDEEHMRRVVLHVMREQGDGWVEWQEKDAVLIGVKLIELFADATQAVAIEMRREGGRTTYLIRLNPAFRTWLAQLDDKLGLMSPEYLPCVVPPKDWDGIVGGGYHTPATLEPLALVKTRNKAHKELLAAADLSLVYRAVNAIQRTPWKVEPRTLAVMREIIERRLDLPVLPAQEDLPIPARPGDLPAVEEKLNEEQLVRLKEWKRSARETYEANEKLSSRRLQAFKVVAIATEFAAYPAIYFPHQLDFRGRIYAVPQVLNPQGADFAKGLLVFAEGAPLDNERAQGWFMIHGANTFGNDKVPFDERIQWVNDHDAEIIESATAPLENLWWTEADSPFCFLSWCFEYMDWQKHYLSDQPGAFMSRIPVAIDGTCNGLQHYSAMLRDPVGGRAVNLTPSEKPQDIYGEVAKVVVAKLTVFANTIPEPVDGWAMPPSEEQMRANKWLQFGIDRKITKRPVMVLPYGGTASSCREYVELAVKERSTGVSASSLFGDDLRAASNWLAGIVWESIGDVVVAARAAMGWLMDTARLASHDGKGISWVTPSGFPVLQAYLEMGNRHIDTMIHGHAAQLQLSEEKESIDKRRQANGVAPNFVHSLDAAALVLTVDLALDNGVTRFAAIHDSYGTNAPDTDVLAACTRMAFVSMYEDHEVLAEFRSSVVSSMSEKAATKVPSVPTAGGLDLALVLDSPFFFA